MSDFLFGLLCVDIGVALGIAFMCLITINGGCYHGCLMRQAVGIKDDPEAALAPPAD